MEVRLESPEEEGAGGEMRPQDRVIHLGSGNAGRAGEGLKWHADQVGPGE